MKYFCIINEKIVYMECVIQSSMFYSFYLFLSILLCNVDSALVSDSTVVFHQKTPIQIFLRVFLMITLAPRQKILSQIAIAMYCGLYFWSIKTKQNHSSYCRTKESRAVGDEQHVGTRKVWPQRVAARRQKEFFVRWRLKSLNGMLSMTSTSMMWKLIF